FFFFQAEDGIRDPLVTGVQTCALPISRARGPRAAGHPAPRRHPAGRGEPARALRRGGRRPATTEWTGSGGARRMGADAGTTLPRDRKSTRLNSSHEWISYAVFCLKKKT